MNKVITINLNGNAYQLEEGGYDALRSYLDGAARRLEGNPDKDEIIADIEQAIADKCRAILGVYKNVVGTQEINQIIEEMGPVQDAAVEGEERPPGAAAAGPAGPGAAAAESGASPRGRRLYKIHDGAMIAGVCNGLALYLGIDPTIVRLLFVLLTFFWGFAILVYLVLVFILPSPGTAAEKAAAYGVEATAQEFIRRAREGYYEGMRTLGDRHAHREWRRRFKREMRTWGRTLKHEVQAGAYRWHQHWQPPGVQSPGPTPGLWIALPFLALLRGFLAFLLIFALISLVTTGAIFGLSFPADVPVWLAAIIVVVIYSIVVWPLRVMRHNWYWRTAQGPHFAPPLFWLGDTIIWLGFVVVLIWLADRYVPHAHEALMNLPPVLHQAADTVKQWWSTR